MRPPTFALYSEGWMGRKVDFHCHLPAGPPFTNTVYGSRVNGIRYLAIRFSDIDCGGVFQAEGLKIAARGVGFTVDGVKGRYVCVVIGVLAADVVVRPRCFASR